MLKGTMSDIPNASNANPGVFTDVETLQTGVNVATGTRTALLIGEGQRREVLVSSAKGNGNDGFDPTYTTTVGSDGRHFLLGSGNTAVAPVVQNRSQLFKNGVPLTILEHAVDGSPFSNTFQAELDPTTGEICLQAAYLVSQVGNQFYYPQNNVGTGTLSGIVLLDVSAPTETWIIRCSTVQRDGYGNPIDGYARFLATGSVSGRLLDGYGNQIVWQSNGASNQNAILQFAISEGSTAFQPGDSFVIQVQSGALLSGDSLVAIYIPQGDINDIEFFTDQNLLDKKHGQPSYDTNQLSLGAQLAFANQAPGVYTCETAPPLPRRTSYVLDTFTTGGTGVTDLSFELPVNVIPDINNDVHIFITNPVTKVETQILPNKVPFYQTSITNNPTSFTNASLYQYSYTVIQEDEYTKSGSDGYLINTLAEQATFSSISVHFNSGDLTSTNAIQIVNSAHGNNGTYPVLSVLNGNIIIYTGTELVPESGLQFFLVNTAETVATVLLTKDLAPIAGSSLRVTVVDERDAAFYDAGWTNAFEAAQLVDVDIVVPLPKQTISAIFQEGLAHVIAMSNIENRLERVLIIGAINGLTPSNITGAQLAAVEDLGVLEGIQGNTVADILDGNTEDLANYSIANAYGQTYRCIYMYPDQIVVSISGSNVVVDGFYAAAAMAGYLASEPRISEPPTRKTLSGFSILRNRTYSPTVQKQITGAGACFMIPVAGGGQIVWGRTTTISSAAEEQEISVVFIRDAIAKSVRAALEPYIGRAESATTKITLFAVIHSLMISFVSQNLITAYTGLSVQRDPTESRQWNITVTVQPVYGVNWIYVPINVGTIS